MQLESIHIKRFYSHVNSVAALLQDYKGQTPFAHFLKQYFSASKKYGSKDRKQIAALYYGFRHSTFYHS